MKVFTMSRLVVLWIFLVFGLAATHSYAQDDIFEVSPAISGPFELDVDTGSGSIQVRSGSVDEVSVTGKIKVSRRFWGGRPSNADEIIQQLKDNPPVEVSDGRLTVGHISDRDLRRKVSISYEIVVPAATTVKAKTGSGSVRIDDISAPVDVHTGSGSIRLENIGGPVTSRAGSGSISADGVAGAFEAHTGSGSISLTQAAPGDVDVSTGSGSSSLRGIAGSVRASAGSGRITVEGSPDGDWDLHTGSGGVRLSLPDDASFNLDAESNSGGIEIDHPLTVDGRISKRHIRGQVRGGGSLIEIDTGSGGIRIR